MAVTATNVQTILWVGSERAPENLRQAAADCWRIVPYRPHAALRRQLADVALVVVSPETAANPAYAEPVLEALAEHAAVGLFLWPEGNGQALMAPHQGPVLHARADASPAELAAQLTAAASLQPTIRRLRDDLAITRQQMDGTGRRLEVLDEEMRLAARLQRDFLPKRYPEVGPVRFGVVFRPALFVSGDIYDIARLDETNVGFYVVDAVGHGLPAALLTMFIKNALQTKRISGHSYQIVQPNLSLAGLNEAICEQNLSSCQFCTAVYAVLDTRRLRLSYARAGHPEPIVFHADGRMERLEAEGALLGVFPEAGFELCSAQLRSGDRLFLFTDGAEDALCGRGTGAGDLADVLAELRAMERNDLLLALAAEMDASRLDEPDDVTVMVVDVEQQ